METTNLLWFYCKTILPHCKIVAAKIQTQHLILHDGELK